MEPWRAHTARGFTCRVFDSGHFFVHTERAQVVQSVLMALTRSAF